MNKSKKRLKYNKLYIKTNGEKTNRRIKKIMKNMLKGCFFFVLFNLVWFVLKNIPSNKQTYYQKEKKLAYKMLHFFLLLSDFSLVFNEALVATSKTSLTPSPVLAEHSK